MRAVIAACLIILIVVLPLEAALAQGYTRDAATSLAGGRRLQGTTRTLQVDDTAVLQGARLSTKVTAATSAIAADTNGLAARAAARIVRPPARRLLGPAPSGTPNLGAWMVQQKFAHAGNLPYNSGGPQSQEETAHDQISGEVATLANTAGAPAPSGTPNPGAWMAQQTLASARNFAFSTGALSQEETAHDQISGEVATLANSAGVPQSG